MRVSSRLHSSLCCCVTLTVRLLYLAMSSALPVCRQPSAVLTNIISHATGSQTMYVITLVVISGWHSCAESCIFMPLFTSAMAWAMLNQQAVQIQGDKPENHLCIDTGAKNSGSGSKPSPPCNSQTGPCEASIKAFSGSKFMRARTVKRAQHMVHSCRCASVVRSAIQEIQPLWPFPVHQWRPSSCPVCMQQGLEVPS